MQSHSCFTTLSGRLSVRLHLAVGPFHRLLARRLLPNRSVAIDHSLSLSVSLPTKQDFSRGRGPTARTYHGASVLKVVSQRWGGRVSDGRL